MAQAQRAPDAPDQAISDLWNVIRALELMQSAAVDIAAKTGREVNSQAEGVAGTCALAITQIRQTQMLLGDPP